MQPQKFRGSEGDEARLPKKLDTPRVGSCKTEPLTTELLILPDGRILVHNLTQPFAELLKELNPDCEQISSRATRHSSLRNEFPN